MMSSVPGVDCQSRVPRGASQPGSTGGCRSRLLAVGYATVHSAPRVRRNHAKPGVDRGPFIVVGAVFIDGAASSEPASPQTHRRSRHRRLTRPAA